MMRTPLRQHTSFYKHMIQLPPGIYPIEGPISIGKSTLGPVLADACNNVGILATYLPEIVNQHLKDIYLANMSVEAVMFQCVQMVTRLMIYKDAARLVMLGHRVFVDRGLVGDFSFGLMQRNLGYFSDAHWEAYHSLVKEAVCYEATAILHLVCSAEVALSRCKFRGDPAEKAYQVEYMENHHKATLEALAIHHHGPILTLNWNEDLSDSGNKVRLTKAKIEDILKALVTVVVTGKSQRMFDPVPLPEDNTA